MWRRGSGRRQRPSAGARSWGTRARRRPRSFPPSRRSPRANLGGRRRARPPGSVPSLTQAKLAELLEGKGRPLNKAAILRIEKGQRGVSLDEALALAAVLYVAPAHLLSPSGDEFVWLTDEWGVDGGGLRNWLLFGDPLLATPEGQRVMTRMNLVFTIEKLAQAVVDAKRGRDTAGSQKAAEALRDAILNHQHELETIERQEEQ